MPNAHTPVLDELLAGEVIDRAKYEAAREKLRAASPEIEPFDCLGTGVAWLMAGKLLCNKDLDALAAANQGACHAIRHRALNEFIALGDVATPCTEDEYDQLTRQVAQALHPRPSWPSWLWLGGFAAGLGILGWYWLTSPGAGPMWAAS